MTTATIAQFREAILADSARWQAQLQEEKNQTQAQQSPATPLQEYLQKLQEKGISVPNEYICPITMEIMQDPVILQDGHVYERQAIQRWFLTKDKSPLTNCPVDKNIVIPCHVLKSLIKSFLTTHGMLS